MDLSQMSEIAGTGFFFSRLPSGDVSFARKMGDNDIEEMDPATFGRIFGSEVESPDAREQAQNILGELNSSRKTGYALAGAEPQDIKQQEQELRQTPQQAQTSGFLGQVMGAS